MRRGAVFFCGQTDETARFVCGEMQCAMSKIVMNAVWHMFHGLF